MVSRDKHSKFKELAEKRVNRALKDIRLIGNLSNKNNYHYEPGEVQTLIKALENELRALKLKFNNTSSESTIFKFEE